MDKKHSSSLCKAAKSAIVKFKRKIRKAWKNFKIQDQATDVAVADAKVAFRKMRKDKGKMRIAKRLVLRCLLQTTLRVALIVLIVVIRCVWKLTIIHDVIDAVIFIALVIYLYIQIVGKCIGGFILDLLDLMGVD